MNRHSLHSQRASAYAIAAAVLTLCVPAAAAPPARQAAKAPPLANKPLNLWYRLTENDQPIGWLHRTAAPARWHGQPAWKSVLDNDMIEPVHKTKVVDSEVEYTRTDGTLLEVLFNLAGVSGSVNTDALFKGRTIDVTVRITPTGSRLRVTQRSKVTLKPGVRLSPDTVREVPPQDLIDGKEIDRWSYNPISRKVLRDVTTVVGETNEDLPGHPGADVWELSRQAPGSPSSQMEWVDPQGIAVMLQISIPGIPDITATVAPHHVAAKR